MGALFNYFANHASYELFDVLEFIKIQNCPTRQVCITQFKAFVESVSESTDDNSIYKKARRFANRLKLDKFEVLQQTAFIEYWRQKELIYTRTKLREIENKQTASHVYNYGTVFGRSREDVEASSSSSTDTTTGLLPARGQASSSDNTTTGLLAAHLSSSHNKIDIPTSAAASDGSDRDYESRESTPSSTSSKGDNAAFNMFYLVHDEDSYEYKLNNKSLRWVVNTYDVSDAFFKYRDKAIYKAEDFKELNLHEQLALDGIMLIDNEFYNTDIINFENINDINNIQYFQHGQLSFEKQSLVLSFARHMANIKIDIKQIKDTIKQYEFVNNDDSILCEILTSLVNTYSSDYSTQKLNESTLVRDTIDLFLKAYFPNNTLMKSIGADAMIQDSAKRFTRIDPSLVSCGKRADFSLISNKSNHLLLSLEAKSNTTKHIDDLIKLCRELKDSMKSINGEGHKSIKLSGIVMKGNSSNTYVMDHEFDGLYRVVLLKRFFLPQNCYDMNRLLSIFPVFDKLKLLVNSSARSLRNPPVAGSHIPEHMVSMHTPIIMRETKHRLNKNDPYVKNARRKLF